MLVEFRVKNFRSLRDEQVLSLVASKDKTLMDTHTLATGLTAAPRLLKSAAIYGANASGKSNLVKALQFMRGVVLGSAGVPPGHSFAVQPFRLDTESGSRPTEFEVTFILEGVRYQYGFAVTKQRIMAEHLLVYKASKPQRWFERRFNPATGKDDYKFSTGLTGPKNVWEGATRPNALFLSMAAQLNSEVLSPVFDWFSNGLLIFNEEESIEPQYSIQMLKTPKGKKQIIDFLRAADINIASIEVVSRKVPLPPPLLGLLQGKIGSDAEEVDVDQVFFTHKTEQGKAQIDSSSESAGTCKLFFLAGPLLDLLRKGPTLIIDELDNSLHTLLVRYLIGLFHRPEVNTGGAQLIFTTHDTSLLGAPDLFRRDQVWLVDKDAQQASSLVALSEFSPRKNEALERGYLIGRYGGVPLLSESLGMLH